MEAAAVTAPARDLGFYVRAKEALEAGKLDQDLEDKLDRVMGDEDDAIEEAEIENAMFGEDIDVSQQLKTHVTPAEFTEFAIRIPVGGQVERFSFEGRRYLRQPYNTAARRTLLKCARQTEKSTMLGNKSIAYCGICYGFKVLYVSATATQATVFSVDRLKEPIDISPELSYLIDSGLSQNVLFKQFKNRSQVRIRYAFLNADRTRGIPADMILIDEIQDIIFQNVPVIEQCASHSPWKLFCYSGTPKSMDNTIETYWSEFSTQNEWVVPCEACGGKHPDTWHWNVLGVANIGKRGPVCSKCKRPINPAHPSAQWASMQPVTEENAHRVAFESYHISQLMVPWIVNDPGGWHDNVLFPLENYDTAKFNNEVLGLSYDSGQRPLTKRQVEACCQASIHMYDHDAVVRMAEKCYGGVAAGLDHGCHDDQTRILTDSGFKYFAELTDSDLVAQFDKDTRMMSFVRPIERTVRDWNGDLYHFNGKATDMMLTPDHRMLLRLIPSGKWWVEPTKKVAARGSALKLRGYVDWEGTEEPVFTLPGLPKSPGYGGSDPLPILMDDWLELLGYLVSEGGLCLVWNKKKTRRTPSCVKISQRGSNGRMANVQRIRDCLRRVGLRYSEFPDSQKPGDYRWTIYGKQLWSWVLENVGSGPENKRIPRQFLGLSKRQLGILFDALVFGDGTVDPRPECDSGAYYSTSRGLCEDVQELCVRLGRRATVRPHKPADEVRMTRYRVLWAGARDRHLNYSAIKKIRRVPYQGKVYCCKVPTGFIVTERNGCLAYQGNTGENESYSVLSLGGYLGGAFQIFYIHRFTGEDLNPQLQLLKIAALLKQVNFVVLGSDYGGGFDRNDWLIRNFGPNKVMKYQYASAPKKKIKWEPALGRFMLHRTEVMADVFNAIRQRKIWFPNYEEFRSPFSNDLLNIFSEYNQQIHMTQYKVSPGKSDDSFHSILYCFLASMFIKARPDILVPTSANNVDFTNE